MHMRSWLFVPGDDERKLAKVAASDADAVIIDLEDAVAAGRKEAARALTDALLRDDAARHRQTWVRVNALGSRWHNDDVAMLQAAIPDGFVVPKVNDSDELTALAERLDLPLLPLTTETPRGVQALTRYSDLPRTIVGLSWGAEDLAAELGATTNRDEHGQWLAPFALARSWCLLAARANGVAPIDTVYTDLRDSNGLLAYAAQSRQLGFDGMLAIHPRQVPLIHAGFRPEPAEIEHARAVLEAFNAADDTGVAVLEGRMLDEPHRRQALRLLALADDE
ncbi:MAG: CoA ester lyase [Pseudomonadota bacterium]